MAAILDLPLERFTELYWKFRVPYDAAKLTPAGYWKTVADGVPEEQLDALIQIDSRSWGHAAPGVAEWARGLHGAGMKTAILSNMPVPVRDYVIECSWLPEFHARTFSCDVGVCKPEREMYDAVLEELGARPEQVLFLDDRESNIRAAEALGLHAVLFKESANAAIEIERRFALPVTLSNLL